MRDHDNCAYYREDAGSLLIGAFEPNAIPWGQKVCRSISPSKNSKVIWNEQFMPVLEQAMYLRTDVAGMRLAQFFCGRKVSPRMTVSHG